METKHLLLLAAALVAIYLLTRKQRSVSTVGATDLGVPVGAPLVAGASAAAAGASSSALPAWARTTTKTYVGDASKPARVTADATSDEGAAAAAAYYGVPLSELTEQSVVAYNYMIEQRKKRAGKS